MKKILVLAHHLVPYTPSYGQIARHLTLINQLAESYEVHVVTVKGNKDYGNFGFEYSKKVKFYFSKDINYFPEEVSRPISGTTKASKALYVVKNYGFLYLVSLINKKIKSMLLIDRYEFSAVGNFYKKTSTVIKKNNFSIILVMTPPFSMYKLAYLIKKNFNHIPIILDIQDSWVVPALLKNKSILAKRSKKIEKRSINIVDGVAFNIPIMKKKYDEFYNIAHKSELFMNGFDYEYHKKNKINNNTKLKLNDKKLNIGYFGKIHIGNDEYFRDIRKFFNFFKKVDKNFKDKIHLDIYGHFSGNYKKWYDFVPFSYRGKLNFNDVSNHMNQYDALMIFHSDKSRAEEVLTGKIFEYLYARKPVIVLGPENMIEARNLIEKNNLGIYVNIDDESHMKNQLNHLFKLKYNNLLVSSFNQEFELSSYSRKKINLEYLDWINKHTNT